MKSAIVTGSSGFVGKNLVLGLLKLGYKVYGVQRSKPTIIDNNFICINIDLQEVSSLKDLISDEIDFFFHFAWHGTSGDERSNYKNQLKNVEYSCDCVKAAYELKVRKFIFAGSIMEYESLEASNRNLFDSSLIYSYEKYNAHYLSQIMCNKYEIEFESVCISNIFGVGEKSKRFLNTFLHNLSTNQDMQLSSCEQLYDFIYMDDAIEAIICVAEFGTNNSEYYIGSSKPKKLKELLVDIRNEVNPSYILNFSDKTAIVLDYSKIDCEKIYRELGYKENYGIIDGIKNVIKYEGEK